MEGQGKVCELLLKSVLYQNVIGFTAMIPFRNHSLGMPNFLTFAGEYPSDYWISHWMRARFQRSSVFIAVCRRSVSTV